MAITQNILNFDEYYRTTTGDKVIVNDVSPEDIRQSDFLLKSLMTIYDNSEVISSKPSCDCGKLQGLYLLGELCHNCQTTVKDINQKIDPICWLRAFNRETPFLNTAYWMMLSNAIDSKTDWLRYLTDTKYNPPIVVPQHILAIRDFLGGERSYVKLINSIEPMLEFMLTLPKYKPAEKVNLITGLQDIYKRHKNDLFSTYLPIVNKKLFVMENTNKGRFVDLITSDVVNVAISWSRTATKQNEGGNLSQRAIENTTASVISALSKLYKDYFINYVGKKKGILRKHVYGARSHFTFRTVIVSIPGPHEHDEIIIPWSIMVTLLRPFILNKLEKRGYTYKDSDHMLFKAVISYIPEIDEILQELVNEAPGGKLSFLQQRNLNLSYIA